MYKKRVGTSGIRGQLYETKLISLIHFRAKYDDNIKDYNLATNVDEIGTFDDICFKAKIKIKGKYKAVAVFLQAKHREGDKVLTLNSKNDLAKYFDSYLNIRRAFKPGGDVLFKGNFNDTECFFVMYTTAKDDSNIVKFESDIALKLNSLISTGDNGLQPIYKDEDVEFLCEIIMKEQFSTLAGQMAKFLNEGDGANGCIMSMNDDLVLLYHVILGQKVFDLSEVRLRNEEEEHRIATFRKDFFTSHDEYLMVFKETLYIEILKKRKLIDSLINDNLTAFLKQPTITTLSELIGNVVTYNKKGKLEFVNKSTPDELKRQLDKVNIVQTMVDEAIELSARAILTQRQFKVPAAFGNRDLTVRGKVDVNIENKDGKGEMRISIEDVLDNLKLIIVKLLQESQADNLVTIDESLGEEILQLNAGLASAIGNIFIYDENVSLIKFTDKYGSLGDLGKRLMRKVELEVPNLQEYKIRVKVGTFPKLSIITETDDENQEMVKHEMIALGEHIGKFLGNVDDLIMPMDNKLVLRYHVILVQHVIDVSEVYWRNEDEEHRIASFREEFFNIQEGFLVLFKDALYKEITKSRKLEEDQRNCYLSTLFNEPSDIIALSRLIGNTIECRDGKFKCISNMSEDLKAQLNEIAVSQAMVNEAIELSAKELLAARQFKVMSAFGNKDLTIRAKKGIKVERRLKHLNMKMAELIKNADTDKIVVFKESLEEGLLKPSGSIAGLVGNMLVPDENAQLMKITDKWESLEELSKRLFLKLQSEIPNLHEYKFDVKVKKFPKHSFVRRENDEDFVKDFLKKLLFYTNQADESGVEECLKGEIEDHECRNAATFRVTSDAIFLKYHDEIQKWWMLAKQGPYLTKQCKLYDNALKYVVDKPLMTVMTLMYKIKIQQNLSYTYNKGAMNSLLLTEQPSGTIFITENIALTVSKMLQCLQNKDNAVLELEYVLNLQANEFNVVRTELTNTDNNKALIIVWVDNKNLSRRLENIVNAINIDGKRIFFVTKYTSVETIQSHFDQASNVVSDDRIRLIDMSEESKNSIIQDTKAILQDNEVGLDLLADKTSAEFVKGDVLNKIINNEQIVISKTVTNFNYEKIKHLYIERRVIRSDKLHKMDASRAGNFLVTLYDIPSHVVVIIAKPGMGKSTLLTHLSLKTKEINPNVWIVRINLLDKSREFNQWQKSKTEVNTLETLVFMCKVVLSEKYGEVDNVTINLEEEDDAVKLKHCNGDEWIVFEIKMFLHFYNTKELIFLFDGFDEICPHYSEEVVKLMRIVRNYPRKHKIWITTRSYDKVKSILEEKFGISHELQHFSENEQNTYLTKFWKSKIIFKDLKDGESQNICTFMEFISQHYHRSDRNNHFKHIQLEKHQILYIKVCLNFLGHLRNELDLCSPIVVATFNSLFSDCYHTIKYMEDFDTPLYVYLIADYLQAQIKDTEFTPNKWNLDINAFTIYDNFFETKLKEIRFKEKNKIDLNISDNRIIYDEIKAEFLAKHKKLGAFAVFHEDADKIFNYRERNDINETLDKIKGASEKTGLIHSVANGVPVFVHMTFTEYFAVEHICSLLKTENANEKRRLMWDFILNVLFLKSSENVRNVLNYKIKTDVTLKNIVNESDEILFDLLLKQGKGVYTYREDDFSKELYLKIKLSLEEAFDNDLCNFIHLLYKIKVKLTEEYLWDPTRATSRVKRLKFLHYVQKKRRALDPEEFAHRVANRPLHRPVRIQNFSGRIARDSIEKPT